MLTSLIDALAGVAQFVADVLPVFRSASSKNRRVPGRLGSGVRLVVFPFGAYLFASLAFALYASLGQTVTNPIVYVLFLVWALAAAGIAVGMAIGTIRAIGYLLHPVERKEGTSDKSDDLTLVELVRARKREEHLAHLRTLNAAQSDVATSAERGTQPAPAIDNHDAPNRQPKP